MGQVAGPSLLILIGACARTRGAYSVRVPAKRQRGSCTVRGQAAAGGGDARDVSSPFVPVLRECVGERPIRSGARTLTRESAVPRAYGAVAGSTCPPK